MIESDTIKLLRECDAGIKMGISSISDVIGEVKSDSLEKLLKGAVVAHRELLCDSEALLHSYEDEGKSPNPIATGMSKVKTNLKMAMKHTDKTIADLMTDGCNMGVKSLSKYLNEYKAASEQSKDVAKRLVSLEEKLAVDIREYL